MPTNSLSFIILFNKQSEDKLVQLAFEDDVLRSDIEQMGYSLTSHGISKDEIDAVISAYAEFTDNLTDPDPETLNRMITNPDELDEIDYLADTQRDWHKYRTNHPQLAKPGGYTNRSLQVTTLRQFGRGFLENGNPIVDDPKEFYHFHPNSLSKMLEQHKEFGWGHIPPEVYALNRRFLTIHRLARAAITGVLIELEEDHPELLSRYSGPKDLDDSPLRLIFYHPGQGDILAAPHKDKSSFTMQIAESHMGLRVMNPQTKKMELVKRPAESGVVFPGFSWDKMYPQSTLQTTEHDVINIDEANAERWLRGQFCARWALIWFSNSNELEIPKKTDTHSSLRALVT